MSEPDSYTSHNFDAVNEQIREIAARERARTNAYRLESYKTGFIYAGAMILILGLFAIMLAWSYRLIISPMPNEVVKIVKPEIIEKEVIKVVQVPVEKSIYDSSSTSYSGPIVPVNQSSTFNSSENQSPVVTNYNTFQQVDASGLGNSNISEVVTGWRYEDSDYTYPNKQYCYFLMYSPGKESPVMVDLASMSKDGEYESYINTSLAREVSMSQRSLRMAEELCQWAGA